MTDRYKKDAEASRRAMKQAEKATADLVKRRKQIEQRIRQAGSSSSRAGGTKTDGYRRLHE